MGSWLARRWGNTMPIGANKAALMAAAGGGSGPEGQNQYTSANTYTWTAPEDVESICVVCVGAGKNGTGAGALAWKNDIVVVPGSDYTVVVPASTSTTRASFNGDSEVSAGNYQSRTGTGGGDGGNSGHASGGAGGYSGDGGDASGTGGGSAGVGGAAGSGGFGYAHPPEQYGYAAGGGVGLQGEGSNGAGGTGCTGSDCYISGGGGGSGGSSGAAGNMSGYLTSFAAGSYGGQGYNSSMSKGGAVRIIWGSGRAFPSTNTADV